MTNAKDFRQGDRVHHSYMNEMGTIAAIKDGVVEVIYDRRSERLGGKNLRGKYDALWFNLHADCLTKRNTQ